MGHGQQPHRRPQDGGDAPHHAAGDLRHLHGLLHGDALGHQLAEHQGEVGQDDGHRHQGHRVEHRGGEADAQAQQPVGEHLREGVSGEGGAQEARQGDGDLDGGEDAALDCTIFRSLGAERSPSSAIMRSLPALREMTAISVMAKKALTRIRMTCKSSCWGILSKSVLSF